MENLIPLDCQLQGIAHAFSFLSSTFWANKRFAVPYVIGPFCLSVLSVTLVYCGLTVGWIKIPLGTEVGLGPGYIVLDGDPAPQKGVQQPPLFGPLRCSGTVAHFSCC